MDLPMLSLVMLLSHITMYSGTHLSPITKPYSNGKDKSIYFQTLYVFIIYSVRYALNVVFFRGKKTYAFRLLLEVCILILRYNFHFSRF